MHPLARRDDLNAAVIPDKGHPSLGLEIGVFLRVGAVDAFHDHVGLGEAGLDVPVADVVVQEHIGIPVPFAIGVAAEGIWVQDGCIRLEGSERICDHGQLLVIHLDESGRVFGLSLGLRHHQGYVISLPADYFRLFRAARPAEHGLIRHDESVLVHRHVSRGQHRDDARCGLGLAHVQSGDAGMGDAGEDDLHPGLAR